MHTIAFSNFRGFNSQKAVKVRPLTILVGENSAGKTSFLAGLKFATEALGGYQDPSFNGDPFQLGTFQQIAHFRGGRGGRAQDFRIELRANVAADLPSSETKVITATITFGNVESQAQITSIRFYSKQQSLLVSLTSDGSAIEFSSKDGKRTPLSPRSGFPHLGLGKYWRYLIQDAIYSLHSSMRNNKESDIPRDDDRIFEEASEFFHYVENLSESLLGSIEATSAIRMKPSRTYTPGAETRDGEGSHVPYEIAKLYRSRAKNKKEWESLKLAFEKFGHSSGMFKEISVKSFGQTTSDPFQIQFSSDGPKTNIVDLGYGTSQILPILYSVSDAPEKSTFFIQQPEVHLHAKAQAALGQYFVETFASQKKNFVLETHSDFIVDRVRNGISTNLISKEDVSILFFKRSRLENKIIEIELDDLGDPINPPEDYRSFFLDEQMKMLGL